jgi:hypothetical protein
MSHKPGAPPAFEIIQVPNVLLRKVGGGLKDSRERLVAQAENALDKLSSNYAEWLEQEITGLEAARATVKASGLTPETASALTVRALDLKGLGKTYEFPLIARIAGSLFNLLDRPDVASIPMVLVNAHVDGCRALVRGGIRDPAHPVGCALADQLEGRVREFAAA